MQKERMAVNENVVQFPAGGKQVKADICDGYVKIANTLIEAVCRAEVSGRQLRILLSIIRRTYGFNKKSDWCSPSQVAAMIGSETHLSNIRKDLRDLKDRKIIIQNGEEIGPNPIVSDWVLVRGRVKNNSKTSGKQLENELKTTHKRVENNSQSSETQPVETVPRVENNSQTSGKQLENELKTTPTKDNNNLTKDKNKDMSVCQPTPNSIEAEAIEYLNAKTGRNFKPVKVNLSLVTARLKEGYTLDDVKAVIDRQNSLWAHNPKMREYLRPSTLFNAEKFNQYAGLIGSDEDKTEQQKIDDWINEGSDTAGGDFIDGQYTEVCDVNW